MCKRSAPYMENNASGNTIPKGNRAPAPSSLLLFLSLSVFSRRAAVDLLERLSKIAVGHKSALFRDRRNAVTRAAEHHGCHLRAVFYQKTDRRPSDGTPKAPRAIKLAACSSLPLSIKLAIRLALSSRFPLPGAERTGSSDPGSAARIRRAPPAGYP